jgi:hypothetical protein
MIVANAVADSTTCERINARDDFVNKRDPERRRPWRANNGGLGARPPVGSRGSGVQGAYVMTSPLEPPVRHWRLDR